MPETSNSTSNGEETIQNIGSKNSFAQLNKIRALAGYSILLTCLIAGAGVATLYWTRSTRTLQQQLTKAEEELSAIKAEYSEYRNENPPKTGHDVTLDQSVIVRVDTGSAATILGGSLSIKIISIEKGENPTEFKISGIITSSDSSPMNIQDATVGSITTFTTERNSFTILVVEADAFSAKFLITPKGS